MLGFSNNSAKVHVETESNKGLSSSPSARHHRIEHGSSKVLVSELDYYDFCLVFPTEKKANGEWDITDRGFGYLENLQDLGFEIFSFRVVGQKPPSLFHLFTYCWNKNDKEKDNYCIAFVMLKAPLEKLRECAERIELRMMLDPVLIQQRIEAGNIEAGIAGVKIRHEPNITPLWPYDFIYSKYKKSKEELFYKPKREMHTGSKQDDRLLELDYDHQHPFRDLLRLKLSSVILQSRPRYLVDGKKFSAQNLKIARYLKHKWLLGCFLMHKASDNFFFRQQWSDYPFKALPLEEIKEYFGEKKALYHAYMDHYTKFLIIPAVVSIPFQIMVWFLNNYSASFIPFYAVLLPVWSVAKLDVSHPSL